MRPIVFVKRLICLLALLLSTSHGAFAQQAMSLGCNSYSPLETMFSDVCWSGIFPIRLAGVTFMDGKSGVPSDASKRVVCTCGGDLLEGKLPRIGFTVGFWAPSKIIDVTRRPYCMPSLGGLQLPLGNVEFLNSGANMGRGDNSQHFSNWVLYSFPIIWMLRLIDEGACPADGLMDFDVITASPMFPNWNDVLGRYTAFINPEMLLFAGATSLYALPVDAASATAGQPINDLFWVAGAWGPGYPMTGFSNGGTVDHQIEPVRATSLSAFRGLSLMHRLGFLSETIGSDNLCERNQRFVIRKDAYRWQFLAPSPESDGPAEGAPPPVNSTNQVREVNPPSRYSTCTHPTGASTVGWGMWRDVPATGEDHSYLLFQWTDCCFGVYGD
ncbi:TraU family protein [Alicycliphilus denitrificans]|uniref:TraU family protein n=1 Tax=Alicycliphilus denitrificans TaxID=179636 RepID=UPI0001F69680|nr:TraU family protein [Alicycliphilus denitrificans]ADV02143.1 TraU family protein [Alicycliphilus denitrificans BC]